MESSNPSTFRIIDANCNRTSEALRVVEDYARFVLNSPTWSEKLKTFRHDVFEAVKALEVRPSLAAFRDTPGDVGTGLSAPSEKERASTADVLGANLKRAQEGLRVLEEYSKLISPGAGDAFKALRYKLYAAEKGMLAELMPHARLQAARLYVLVTTKLARGRTPDDVARAAIRGGADVIQLREKEMADGEYLALARRIREICREMGAVFIVNDRADVARLVDADGVHVGQEDLPAGDARMLLGPDKIVGVSTHSPEQVRAAIEAGASYIGVGPVNATPTKPAAEPVGLEHVRYAAANVSIPFFAIGGVSRATADDILRAGARRLAVCSAIISASDVAAAAAEIKAMIAKHVREGE